MKRVAPFALALVGFAAFAQSTVRVRGTIARLDGDVLTVKSRDGKEVRVQLAPDAQVAVAKATTLGDIKPGTYVGSAAVKRSDGTLVAKEVLKLPLMQSFLVQMIAAVVMVIVVPIAGAVSDRYPRKPLLLGSLIGYLVLLYPLYGWVVSEPSIAKLLVCQIVIGCFSAFFLGVYCTTLVELFPVRVRSTSLSIVNNVAVLVFGGFAQFFVTWLITLTGSPLAPIFYVMIGVGLGLISVIAMRPDAHGASMESLDRSVEQAS